MHRWFDPSDQTAQLPIAERQDGRTWYALMDYDISILHDDAIDTANYFRPVEEAWYGTMMYHPFDYSQGEWRYNPFAFDVACLGGMIMAEYAVRMLPPRCPSHLTHRRVLSLPSRSWHRCSTR